MSRKSKGENDPIVERVACLETDMNWVKKKLEIIDKRTWHTLGSVVVFGVISVLIAIIGLMW